LIWDSERERDVEKRRAGQWGGEWEDRVITYSHGSAEGAWLGGRSVVTPGKGWMYPCGRTSYVEVLVPTLQHR
jgi:hypothetical protein